MKRRSTKITTKILSIVISLLLIVSCIPVALSASASQNDTRVVDPNTMENWEMYFGESVTNTENAGGIWTDKSVFKDASELPGVSMKEDDNFLVALSAVATNKSITGYSHIPTDTMLVLDVSGSMNSNNNNAVDDLIKAANNAIKTLQEVNKHNRVGIVMYSGNYVTGQTADDGDAVLLLPLDRYTHRNDTFLVKDSNTVNINGENTRTETIKVNTNVTGKENGTINSNYEKDVLGGTYIQAGTYKAMQEFLSQEETEITEDTFQKGTKRMPIMVLMSDGVPTIATNNYMGGNNGVGSSRFGDGTEDTLNNSEYLSSAIPFVAQLSASYAKERIEEKYGRDSLFYTLGFKVDNSAVLDPSKNTNAINNHWATYNNLSAGASMQLAVGQEWVSTGWFGQGYYQTVYQSIQKSSYDLSKDYVTEYFKDDDLLLAFDRIVEQIILQSLYYPTYVEGSDNNLGGYVEFHDDLGAYMDVKDVKGILIGDHLYTGEILASNFSGGSLGTIDNPTDLGDNMIWAVKERLGISDTATAQKLVQDAYADGQLAYNAQTGEYSNYIAWYADANGNYMAFADKDDEKPLEGATYLNTSYGYLGEVIDGHKKADMMYVSVQVHKRLSDGLIGVRFAVPASLIPVVSYNITLTGDSLENPGDITLEYDNIMEVDTTGDGIADTQREVSPIRLVYEAGLKDEINELTVADIVADDYEYVKDGVYTFYTNHWDINTIDQDNHIETVNTVVTYAPSVENERYYYTQDSIVYILDGEDYVPYTGANAPVYGEQTYYRAYQVFELSDEVSAGNARMHTHYEAISKTSLAVAEAESDRPTALTRWYIPMGTIHRTLEQFAVEKSENTTSTVPYIHYPDIQYFGDDPATAENEGVYFTENIHGNNGLMTLTAAQGIKISKEVDETLADTAYTYTFVVEEDEPAQPGEFQTYRLRAFDKNGEEKEAQEVQFENGKMYIQLEAGETAYLIDLDANKSYTVSELDAPNNEYVLKSVNGDEDSTTAQITVEPNTLSEAAFVNTVAPPDTDGALVLVKRVEHPFGPDYMTDLAEEYEPVFTFNITIGDDEPQQYELKANQTAIIEGIPVGTEVTVTEDVTGLEGFTSNYENNTHTFTMETLEYHVVTFTNTYTPQSITPNVTVTGDKSFTGREDDEWLDRDSFTFKLEKWANNEWVEMGTDVATKDDPTFDFTDIIQTEVYDHAGRYSYRITEVYDENPYQGITYDQGVRWFDIIVADSDMDGFYEVSMVEGYQGAEVSETENGFNVHSVFNNTYAPTGSDAVTIVINKTVFDTSVEDQADSTVSNSGYLFGLYQGDQLVQEFPETVGGSGETMLTLTFGAQDIGQYISYTLKEIVPDIPQSNVIYSDKEYLVEVFVEDDTYGGVTAQIAIAENVDSGPIDIGEQITVGFTNTYDPTDTTLEISGKKTLVGREIVDGEFTFELYKTNGEEETLIDTTTNVGTAFAFDALTYDKVGIHNYKVVEKSGDDTNITYDSTVHMVYVAVTDVDGTLVATAYGDNDELLDIEFVNIYDPTDATLEISGKKTLVGREIVDGEFTFELYEIDEEAQTLIDSKTNVSTTFTFDKLTFDKAGTYQYKVVEKAGDDANITYDSTEHMVYVSVEDMSGQLVATAYGSNDDLLDIEFINTYEEPTEPETEPTEPETEPTEPETEPTEPETEPTEPETEPTEPETEPTEKPTQSPTEKPTEKPTQASGTNTSTTSPKTGDTSTVLLWFGAITISAFFIKKAAKKLRKKEQA
ncbi:MAG: hypothetical protein E7513_06860 [Ruminococcaceae bacterium]|nr:hypothetical protein [Oscillospiraceae bacterium]